MTSLWRHQWRQNFRFSFFGLKWSEICWNVSNQKIFAKKWKMKIFPLRGLFWDLEIFGKIHNFRFLFFGLKWSEICWNVLSRRIFCEKSKIKIFPSWDYSGKIHIFCVCVFGSNGQKYVAKCIFSIPLPPKRVILVQNQNTSVVEWGRTKLLYCN